MKIYPLYYLLVCASSLFLFSCKKNSGLPNQGVPPNTTNINPTLNPVIAHTVANYNFSDTTLTKNGWTKTFEDNFDGDLSQWNIWHGGGLKQEVQCYQASNLQISNGELQIISKAETVTGPTSLSNDTLKTFNFTSGGIESKFSISANTSTPKVRIVARIKIAKGYGMASSFWSYGDNWPTQGEIDYMESRGDDPTIYFIDYFYGTTLNQNIVPVKDSYESNPTDCDLSVNYHVYEMEWSQNALISYLDGKPVATKSGGGYVPGLFGTTQHIALNLAIGGLLYDSLTTANVQTGTIYVDYVKVFTSN